MSLLTTEELAEKLGVRSRNTISLLRKEGLPHTGTGKKLRYDFEEVKKWLVERDERLAELKEKRKELIAMYDFGTYLLTTRSALKEVVEMNKESFYLSAGEGVLGSDDSLLEEAEVAKDEIERIDEMVDVGELRSVVREYARVTMYLGVKRPVELDVRCDSDVEIINEFSEKFSKVLRKE